MATETKQYAILPNEAQAFGWFKAHEDRVAGRPQPRGDNGEWAVPVSDSRPIVIKPLSNVISAPPSPGGSIKAAQLKPEDKPRIAEEVRRKAERRRAEQQAEREAEERRRAQQSFDWGDGA